MSSLGEIMRGKSADDCISLIAESFPTYSSSSDFINSPPELIEKVLQCEKLVFPNSELTSRFFLALFSRGDGLAQYFSDYVPFDEMDSQDLVPLKEKLQEYHLDQEANRFERIIAMNNKIKEKTTECENYEKQLKEAVENLEKYTKQIKETSDLQDKINQSIAERKKEVEALDAKVAEEKARVKSIQMKLLKANTKR